MPWALQRFPRQRLIALSFVGVIGSQLGLAATHSYTLLAASGLLYGISHGALFPTLMARMIDFGGEAAAGRVSVLYMGTFSLGFGLMPLLAGVALPVLGFSGVFLTTGALGCMGLVLASRSERVHPHMV